MKTATSEEILAIAAEEIGYHEEPGKRNKYGKWFGKDGVPWCMEFVQWVYAQTGAPLPYKTASCGELLRWYQKNQPDCIAKTPIPGCVVIFDWPGTRYDTDHTGIFEGMGKLTITTIDGNTSNESEGNGGWVERRTRKLSYANPVFIVPRELEDDMDINKFIEEITPAQVYAMACKLDGPSLYKLYTRLEDYMAQQPLPTSWNAQEELQEAVRMGITDGSRPMVPAKRYETAIMVKRSVKKR